MGADGCVIAGTSGVVEIAGHGKVVLGHRLLLGACEECAHNNRHPRWFPTRPTRGLVSMTDPVRLCAIRGDALSADEVLAALADPACGGQVLFLGRVRDHDHARRVLRLSYSAHTDAEAVRAVCRTVAARHHVPALAAVHRVGDLAIGDLAVIVGSPPPSRRGRSPPPATSSTPESSVPIDTRPCRRHRQLVGLP